MIDQLKAMLKERVDNLDDAQATQAAQAAVDFFKDRLPDPIAGKLEDLVSGDSLDLGDLKDKLSGFLGG